MAFRIVGVTGLGLLLILSGSCGRAPKNPHQETRWTVGAADEQPDSVSYATTYVLYDLALQSSASVQAIRRRCESAKDFSNMCDDSGGASEAIIGLLGAGGDATTDGLLKLIAVQLDGALAESRECEIGKRGRSLLPALRSMDATRAANWCKLEFEALSKRQLAGITDVSSTQVCQPANQIERDRQEWIKSFEAGQEGCGYE